MKNRIVENRAACARRAAPVLRALGLVALVSLLFSCSNFFDFAESINASKFSLTYVANGANAGTAPASANDFAGSKITVVGNTGNLAKQGYVFAGWNTASDGTGTAYAEGSVLTMPDKGCSLYAAWTPGTFKVIYDDQGASTPAGAASVIVTAPATTVATLPADPVKAGFNFGGWWTEPNGNGTQFTATTPVTASITVYAKWTAKPVYAVTFDSAGGSAVATQNVQEGSVATMPAAPTKQGYTFAGWFGDAACTAAWDFNSKIMTATTIYAKWNANTYTVTFDSQSATTSATPDTIKVTSPATTVAALPATPTRTGYTFAGWWTESKGGGTQFTSTTQVVANITLYAMWTTKPVFTVSFNTAGGSAVANESIVQDSLASEPAAPTKAGYIFGGWFSDSACTTKWDFGTATIAVNTSLYARWNAYSYTVTYEGRGATTAAGAASKVVASPATTVVALPSEPAKTGYTFGGWWTGTDGAGIQFTASTPVTGDVTVYAKWKVTPIYTISFDTDGGSAVSSQTVLEGLYATLPIPPTKTGYTFDGWFTDSARTTIWNFATSIIAKDTTIYAKWNSYSYTITYDGQSPTTAAGATSVSVASPATTVSSLPSEPKKTGLFFDGWWTGINGSGTQFTATTPVTGSLTVYANWVTHTPESKFIITSSGSKVIINDYLGTDTTVVIPETIGGYPVTGIADNTFQNKSTITSVTIPDTVKSIGNSAFYGCSRLNSLTIPSSVTSIGYFAFLGCSRLTSLTIPNSVTSIGQSAFWGCSGLTSVTIPDSVTAISDGTFYDCSGLTSVTIPNSVISIGTSAFTNCCGLTSVTIPSSVISISDRAFQNCYGLTSVTIPNTVKSIGNSAFQSCTGLTSVTIPSSVTSISDRAFQDCFALTSVTIPSSVTSIGNYAFQYCSFGQVTIERATPPTLGKDAFLYATPVDFTIKVPAGATAAYKAADAWKNFHIIE